MKRDWRDDVLDEIDAFERGSSTSEEVTRLRDENARLQRLLARYLPIYAARRITGHPSSVHWSRYA